MKLNLRDKNGKPFYEGCVFKYTEHKGYLLPSFMGRLVWWDDFAGYGYQTAEQVLAGTCTPLSSIDELQEDFLNHVEIEEDRKIKNG
jgi:hypothetical protein